MSGFEDGHLPQTHLDWIAENKALNAMPWWVDWLCEWLCLIDTLTLLISLLWLNPHLEEQFTSLYFKWRKAK